MKRASAVARYMPATLVSRQSARHSSPRLLKRHGRRSIVRDLQKPHLLLPKPRRLLGVTLRTLWHPSPDRGACSKRQITSKSELESEKNIINQNWYSWSCYMASAWRRHHAALPANAALKAGAGHSAAARS